MPFFRPRAYVADNGEELTDDEMAAIEGLQFVAANWPDSLAILICADSGLAVVRTGDARLSGLPKDCRREAFLAQAYLPRIDERDLG